MVAPKNRISKSRRDKRRSSHWKLESPNLSACPNCGALRLPHRVCKACGSYKGREVLQVSTSKN